MTDGSGVEIDLGVLVGVGVTGKIDELHPANSSKDIAKYTSVNIDKPTRCRKKQLIAIAPPVMV